MSEPSSSPIVRLGEPSPSAWRVAVLRAVHQLLDEPPVLPDPIALPLLGAATEAALRADPYAHDEPIARGLRAFLVARSRFVEDELARGVAAGIGQYVVLGAGLDTFAYRNPHAGLRVFEVDRAGTQRWKRQLLEDAQIAVPGTVSFVPMDLERDDLARSLLRAGFDTQRPACISWMGVTMYLTADAVLRTLATMAGLAAGSCVCFDHRGSPAALGPVERAVDEAIARQVAAAGEPWLSAFEPEDLRRELLARGFGAAESTTADALNARYFARRRDGLRTGGNARLMCARCRPG